MMSRNILAFLFALSIISSVSMAAADCEREGSMFKCHDRDSLANRCNACFDGTKCGQVNANNQTCICKSLLDDGRFWTCSMKGGSYYRANCTSCVDGTVCNSNNSRGSLCACIDANSDGLYEVCRNMPSNNSWSHGNRTIPKCTACIDGTACNTTGANNLTCVCADWNKDGSNDFCSFVPSWVWNRTSDRNRSSEGDGVEKTPKGCTACAEGTRCGATNAQGMRCLCKDDNLDGRNDSCIIDRTRPGGCLSCNDNTSCGQKNQKNQTCICNDYDRDGKNESCSLSPYRPACEKCSDGTLCNETNDGGFACECKSIGPGEEQNFCYLKYTPPKVCISCNDNTTCGQRNNNGEICECRDINGDLNYELCRLVKTAPGKRFCESCADGTLCGKINNGRMECVCLDIDEDETNELCRLMKSVSASTRSSYNISNFIDRLLSGLRQN